MTEAKVITLYHDEPEEAATNSRSEVARGLADDAVVDYVRGLLTTYWQSATVDAGRMVREEPEPGIVIESFEADEPMRRWYVGPDWADFP